MAHYVPPTGEAFQHRHSDDCAGGPQTPIVGLAVGYERVSAVQVTFDSDEPLDAVIKVIEAVYEVRIRVEMLDGKTRHD